MRKRTKRKPKAHPDAEALRTVLLAMIQAIGHGGLTHVAAQLGMTPSALRKRMLRPGGGFDAATMLATTYIVATKTVNIDAPVIAHQKIGNTVITLHDDAGTPRYGWISASELGEDTPA